MITAEAYLRENIDNYTTIGPSNENELLPVFIKELYNIHKMTILDVSCMLLEINHDIPGIDTLKKHIRRIETITERHTVLYLKHISRYRRKSLIENRIAFVIADGQMYLPFLGLDLNNRSEINDNVIKTFSSSGQLAYLHFLYHENEAVNSTEFAEKMDFTNMTASRALRELYNLNLLTFEIGGKTGRSKIYRRIPDPDYYLKGCIYLQTPVRKTVFTRSVPPGSLIAGLEALSELSMINPTDHPIRAMGIDQYNQHTIETVTDKDLIKDEKLVELQIWSYDPIQFSDGKNIDPLSLYGSLKEESDERIEQALKEALREEPWYVD